MADRELLVRILGDDRDLQRALGNTDKRLTAIDNRTARFGKNVGRAFAAAGIAVGASEIFRIAGDAVSAASDLNEQLSRTEVILGSSAQETIEWSKTTADSFGIAQRAALASTATFAGLFQTVGVSQEKAGELSRSLVELAADMASLQNSSPEEALTALRSGLAGEIEPLRRFNIFLTAARVEQEALAESGKTAVSSLTAQEKALARYNLILRDSRPAQGNFALTSGELANQSRILRANMDDLSTEIGNVLVPFLTDATAAALLLFDALDKFRGIDFSPGFDFPDPPSWITDLASTAPIALVSPAGAVAVGVKKLLDDEAKAADAIGRDVRSERGAEAVDGLREQAEEREEKARDAARAVAQANRRFAAFVKGMGLKLDRAGLTEGLGDDIAVLRELEAAILRAIEREGKTFKLVQQLVDTRLQIAALVEQQANDAKQAGQDAFDATIDALNLDLEMAQATQSLQDDQSALRAIEQQILKRIAAEGETTDLLRQLFNVRQEQADVARRINEQRQETIQSKQFVELGLTEEGDKRTASAGLIGKRAKDLQEQIKGTVLDTEKNRKILDNIVNVMSGQFGAAGKAVRDAAQDMLNTIAGAFDEKTGPLTKTTSLNTKKFLEGLGLSPEEVNALRGRLSSFNSAGVAPGGFMSPGLPSSNLPAGFGGAPIVVQSNVTVTLDGEKVGQAVTKQQQRHRRRNPRQKRGPNRRGGEG